MTNKIITAVLVAAWAIVFVGGWLGQEFLWAPIWVSDGTLSVALVVWILSSAVLSAVQ